MNNNNVKIEVEEPKTKDQAEKGNGARKEMESGLSEAIKKREFSKYYQWLEFELQKEKPEIILQEQFEIFKNELKKFHMSEEVENRVYALFKKEFTENNPIIQCKIFEGILEGIFLQKQKKILKNKLAKNGSLDRIEYLYSERQQINEGDRVCFSSFIMLIAEIARERKINVTRLLENFLPSNPLEIIDKELIEKLKLYVPVDTKKKPKLLIGLIIKAIWERVEKIDERFTSMYRNAPLPPERYAKVTDPEDIINKIINAKKYSENPSFFDKDYLERWLNYLRGKQEVEKAKLEVVNKSLLDDIVDEPLLEVLKELEKRATY